MKINCLVILAIAACAYAEKDENPWDNLVQGWKAVYGKYGYDTYYPLRYRVTRYTYPTYPLVQPPYPAVVQPTYPIPTYPISTYPYPTYPKPVVTYPVRVKASYDPEYFNKLYGFYPRN